MPELTPEQEDQGGIGMSMRTCDTCKSPIIKEFCGRHDIVYYSCRCPFKPDPQDPYHQDHSECWRR